MNNFTINNYEMKRDIINFSKKICEGTSKPQLKFTMDMIYGISRSKDILLSSIAGALDEDTKKAYTIDRLSDNLSNDLSSSIDEAKKDNCIVIEDTQILNSSKILLEKFIENTKKGIEDYVRITIFNDYKTNRNTDLIIYDIEFRNNEFIIYIDQTRSNFTKNKEIIYLGKYKYLNISENGDLKVIEIGNIVNEYIQIVVYKE